MSYVGQYDYTTNYQTYAPDYGQWSQATTAIAPPPPAQYSQQYNVISNFQKGNENYYSYFSQSIIDVYT